LVYDFFNCDEETKLEQIMKVFFLLLAFVLGFANYSFSQFGVSYETRQALQLYNENKFISKSDKSTLTEIDIEGSPYLREEFVNGSIYTVQKVQFEEVPLRYNIFNDELEFKTPTNEVLALATPDIVEKVVMGDTILVFLSYEESNKVKNGYFVLLEEGKASLFVKPGVIYKKATPPAAYKDPEPAKFQKISDEYYLGFGAGLVKQVNNKKNLVAAFPDNQDKIEKYISKNKIKTNKPESLTELVKYYNSL
jgi:hypothetical protein